MSTPEGHRQGWELAVGLLSAAGCLFGELHARLAERGHPDLRPAHGYAFQAIEGGAATASELGERLGITKQSAGEMVRDLITLGYLRAGHDPDDGRRRPVLLTDRGRDALAQSATIFEELRGEWASRAGAARIEDAARTLAVLAELYGRDLSLRPIW